MRFTNEFERREWFGREALKELKRIYPEVFKWDITFTTEPYYEYDAYYFQLDAETQSIVKRFWIEIKIRDAEYDDFILEKKKLKSLIKKRDNLSLGSDDVTFLYINFTPQRTIIWKLKDELLNEVENLVANKATADSRTNKINKEVIYLNPKSGKVFNYILNEKHLESSYDETYLLPKVKEKIKTVAGLEQILFG